MSRFRRMLSLPITSVVGNEVYRFTFKAVVDENSPVYYQTSGAKTHLGIGFSVLVPDIQYPYFAEDQIIHTVIKDLNGNVIVDYEHFGKKPYGYGARVYIDGTVTSPTVYYQQYGDTGKFHYCFVVPEGEYTVEVVFKSKNLEFANGNSDANSDYYSKKMTITNCNVKWVTGGTSGKSSTQTYQETKCGCFRKLLYMSPKQSGNFEVNMTLPNIPTPTNITLENGILTWDEVKNANGYRIEITQGVLDYSTVIYTTEILETSIDISNILPTSGTSFISVYAISNDVDYLDSLPGSITYTPTATS